MSRRPARASRCCACTRPAPTAGSTAAFSTTPRRSPSFRVIAFDLPWHGKSSPPAGWHKAEYKLTSRAYVDTIMAVVDALELDKPVVMGCSIGGRIVLHLALEHAARFRALIGLRVRRPRRALLRPRLAASPGRARRRGVRRP